MLENNATNTTAGRKNVLANVYRKHIGKKDRAFYTLHSKEQPKQ